jgi:hypothetical protein
VNVNVNVNVNVGGHVDDRGHDAERVAVAGRAHGQVNDHHCAT